MLAGSGCPARMTAHSGMPMTYHPYNAHGWRGCIEDGWQAPLADLDAWLAENPGERLVDQPSREVRRIETGQGTVYAKIFHQGSNARGLRQIPDALKWYLRPSRALAILRISQALLDAGFACPVPVLAARRHSKTGWPKDLFISHECGSVPLSQRLQSLSGRTKINSLLATVAAQLHRFHRAGFVHGDCSPENLALTDAGVLVLFDNDRTVRRPWRPRTHAQRRSLANFGMRLTMEIQDLAPFREFLARYAAAAQWTPEQADRETHLVMALAQKRLRAKGLVL